MERLTAWDGEHAYYKKCFEEPCMGGGCEIEDCQLKIDICDSLARYEDLGVTPYQIHEIDNMYLERCHEVAELTADLKAYKDTGIPLEDIIEYKKFEDELVAKSMTFGYVLRLIHADERRKSDE